MKQTDGIDAAQLKAFMDKIERLEEEMANIRADVREIYKEAKEYGYDPKIMRVIMRLKKMEEADRVALDEETETYRVAVGV